MLKYYGADPEFSLEGKVAVITGGAAGIGNATAAFFVRKGARVLIADLSPETADAAKALGEDCAFVCGNLLEADCRRAVFETAVQKFGGIDILVNCAGIVALDNAETLSEEMWDRTMAVNLKASFLMAQAAGKYFIDAGKPGCIVNMASQAGVIALDKHVAYCASKGAIIAMTKVMAYEGGKYGADGIGQEGLGRGSRRGI